MTEAEFLERLARTPRRWILEGKCIRFCSDEEIDHGNCPGLYLNVQRESRDLYSRVYASADNRPWRSHGYNTVRPDPVLRAKMLAACGLA